MLFAATRTQIRGALLAKQLAMEMFESGAITDLERDIIAVAYARDPGMRNVKDFWSSMKDASSEGLVIGGALLFFQNTEWRRLAKGDKSDIDAMTGLYAALAMVANRALTNILDQLRENSTNHVGTDGTRLRFLTAATIYRDYVQPKALLPPDGRKYDMARIEEFLRAVAGEIELPRTLTSASSYA